MLRATLYPRRAVALASRSKRSAIESQVGASMADFPYDAESMKRASYVGLWAVERVVLRTNLARRLGNSMALSQGDGRSTAEMRWQRFRSRA